MIPGVRRKYCWMNGELVPLADAVLHVSTEAVLRGGTVFEGIRAYRGRDGQLSIFRLHDHLDRLFHTSMRFLHLHLPYGPDDLAEGVQQLLAASGLEDDTYIRLVVYIDELLAGAGPEVPSGAFILATEGFNPAQPSMRVTLSPWRRMSDLAMPPRVKSGANYLNSRIATVDAQRKGFDTAVLLNERGKVSEGPAMNIFLVRNGVLVTPRQTDGILEGITRSTIIDIARELALPVEQREVDATELYLADEMFLSGTAYEIAPVHEIDGYRVSEPGGGPITARLRAAYFDMVRGVRPVPDGWLTPAHRATAPAERSAATV
jgi:branched-chain amino acid aminotransferase